MDQTANLYLMCFQYNYGAECVRKAALVLDCIWAVICIVEQIYYFLNGDRLAWILLPFTIFYVTVGYQALIRLINYGTYKAAGMLQTETLAYLKYRKYVVYSVFIELAALACLQYHFVYRLNKWSNGSMDESKEPDQNAKQMHAIARNFAFMIWLPGMVLKYIIAGWTIQNVERSLSEVSIAESNSSSTQLIKQPVL